MNESYSQKEPKIFNRDAIIGLGEDSFRKNYYPQLQQKIMDLERINARNRAIISTIPDILLISGPEGMICPAMTSEKKGTNFMNEILQDETVMKILKQAVLDQNNQEEIPSQAFPSPEFQPREFQTREFQFQNGGEVCHLEARLQKTSSGETLIMIRDMTDRILLERKLMNLAERDSLTGLYNRRKFEEKMKSCNGREMEQLVVVTFDINGLKLINDTIGHLCGDQVVMAAAGILDRIFGQKGILARIGGDEFAVIIEMCEEKEFEEMLSELKKEVVLYNSTMENHALSLAFGYSYHKNGIANMEYLFQEADNNMYQNKLLKKDSIRSTFVKSFMKALEAKDFVSEGHVVRIEKMALMIGHELGLHQDQLDRLVLLTKFHDIGKIGIPDSILKKPAALSDDEWKVMRTHSAIGERIAMEAAEIRDIAHLILKHHEKWDGTGYPLGLEGESIPMECRILAIVDTFDAITNDRPYHAAVEPDAAAKEIERCQGTQFDPGLVDIFLAIYPKASIEKDDEEEEI